MKRLKSCTRGNKTDIDLLSKLMGYVSQTIQQVCRSLIAAGLSGVAGFLYREILFAQNPFTGHSAKS